uniref:Uncharacterized protein n=1 Tax=Nomascus leucogenys TaxID=61853 RepID=A0A2I3HM84_NOMLE
MKGLGIKGKRGNIHMTTIYFAVILCTSSQFFPLACKLHDSRRPGDQSLFLLRNESFIPQIVTDTQKVLSKYFLKECLPD